LLDYGIQVRHAAVVGDLAAPDPHRIDGVERDHPAGGAVVVSVDLVILFIPTGSEADTPPTPTAPA
jgi:hypothetical protein